MKKLNLDEMKAEQARLKILLAGLTDKIETAETKAKLPELKKKFENKYFVYDNGYNNDERWLLYVHITKVNGTSYAIADSFETKTDGESSFSRNKQTGLWICQKQITRNKYMSELKKFKQRIPN